MITMSNFGLNGRLGNQLFQYASLIGLKNKYNTTLKLPEWKYSKYFDFEFPSKEDIKGVEVKEPYFHHVKDWGIDLGVRGRVIDINGFLQSEKYWKDSKEVVKKALTFKREFIEQCKARCIEAFDNITIAISVRRGDYVNNPNYELLPITYYILALEEKFPDWKDCNLIFFSDDMPWCRVHFGCLENAYFSENNSDIEDICLMSECDHFILSNSSFSWWGAYLAELKDPLIITIVHPNYLFKGDLHIKNNSMDFYPERWQTFDHKDENGDNKAINLEDARFIIPLKYDHKDRLENYQLCINQINTYFDTYVTAFEVGKICKFSEIGIMSNFGFLNDPEFHRTRMLNLMAIDAFINRDTKILINWDCDIIIPPMQLLEAVKKIRNGADMVYPYEWSFARIPRDVWFDKIISSNDIGIIGDTQFSGMNGASDAVSFGGAVLFNLKSFFKGGGENENFISFGAEDVERYERFKKLGYKIERTFGNLYHMNHYIGIDSSTKNPYFEKNKEEFEKVKSMSKEELLKYIETWDWKKEI